MWTNVAGIVRIDSPAGAYHGTEGDLAWRKELLTRSDYFWLSHGLPYIAFPPLHFKIQTAGAFQCQVAIEGDMPRGYVAVWGDMEGFGSEPELQILEAWLRDTFSEPEIPLYWVRQGVIHINVDEPPLSHVLLFDAHSEFWDQVTRKEQVHANTI